MKKLAVVLAITALAICVTTAVYGEPVNLSENWYIRITDFAIGSSQSGFVKFQTWQYSSTSLIEPKLLDPGPDQGMFTTYNTLVFDFHAGQASTNDLAYLIPIATLGSDWSANISFSWEIHCDDPQVLFSVYSSDPINAPGYRIWWAAPTGTRNRNGNASLYVSTLNQVPPEFRVSFAPVPEPQSLSALLIPTLVIGARSIFWRRRR